MSKKGLFSGLSDTDFIKYFFIQKIRQRRSYIRFFSAVQADFLFYIGMMSAHFL